MQPEPSLTQEEQPVKPARKTMTVIVVILALAVISLGIWGFMQTSTLKANQASLADLQKKHESLTAEKIELSNNFDAANTKLEAAKTELEETKDKLEKAEKELDTIKLDLAKAKNNAATLQAKIDEAKKFVNVMVGIWVENDSMEMTMAKLLATGDSQNFSLYAKWLSSKSSADLTAWFAYFFKALAKILG